jgi:hypothetical protein
MEWSILAVVYLVSGMAVFAWYIRGNETINSDHKKRSAKILILFPELCLFWPVALFSEIKRRKAVSQVTNKHSN